MEKSILYAKITVSTKKLSKFTFKCFIDLSFSLLQKGHKYSLTYNVSTSSHFAQYLVTISNVVVVKSDILAGVTMTLFCTHGRVSGPSSLLDLRGHDPPRIQCPMSILTSGPETWPWGPVGWRRSSHDRVSRVPACESSPRAKLESDRY